MSMRMTRAQRLALARRRIVDPQPIPIATNGWNTRDALAAMDPSDALVLDNWFPDVGGLVMRGGYTTWATGIGSGAVSTLAEFNVGATRKLIAAGGGAFYDATASGAVGAALASGFANNWWQSIAFNKRLFFYNGQDTPQVYDGATMAAQTFTGATLTNLIGGTAYQNRLFLIEKNQCGFWYGPLLGITGALQFFDFSMLTELGGNLVSIGTISYDGGNGVNDYVCFILSSGEVLIYQGTDPSLAQNWSLAGRYNAAAPISIRSLVRYGGECFLTVNDDHIGLQQGLTALRTGQLPPRSKACQAVLAATTANAAANGWQALLWKAGHRLIFNIPNPDGTFFQHVLNLSNNGWCRYVGLQAATWGTLGPSLLFGGSTGGKVYLAETGNLDNGIQAITAVGQQAWNLLNSPERKRAAAIRPIIQSVGGINYTFGVGYDYGDIDVPVISSTAPEGSPWDTSPWDTSPWSPEAQISPDWHVAGGTGEAVSWELTVSASTAVQWLRTDWFFEHGSSL